MILVIQRKCPSLQDKAAALEAAGAAERRNAGEKQQLQLQLAAMQDRVVAMQARPRPAPLPPKARGGARVGCASRMTRYAPWRERRYATACPPKAGGASPVRATRITRDATQATLQAAEQAAQAARASGAQLLSSNGSAVETPPLLSPPPCLLPSLPRCCSPNALLSVSPALTSAASFAGRER